MEPETRVQLPYARLPKGNATMIEFNLKDSQFFLATNKGDWNSVREAVGANARIYYNDGDTMFAIACLNNDGFGLAGPFPERGKQDGLFEGAPVVLPKITRACPMVTGLVIPIFADASGGATVTVWVSGESESSEHVLMPYAWQLEALAGGVSVVTTSAETGKANYETVTAGDVVHAGVSTTLKVTRGYGITFESMVLTGSEETEIMPDRFSFDDETYQDEFNQAYTAFNTDPDVRAAMQALIFQQIIDIL